MAVIDTTPALFTEVKATRYIAELQAGEMDGWTYTIERDELGTGAYVLISIRDASDNFVGYWTNASVQLAATGV